MTPGVLRALVPHIRTNVVALTLGLSYSLADADMCVFLGALTALRSVDLRYYWVRFLLLPSFILVRFMYLC